MQSEFIKLVVEEFEKRKLKNPKYSLRAFARDLDSNPATISLAMRGRRGLGYSTIKNIVKKLGLNINIKSIARVSKKIDNIKKQKIGLATNANFPEFKKALIHKVLTKNQLVELEDHILNYLKSVNTEVKESSSHELYTFVAFAVQTRENKAPSENDQT